MQIFAVYPDPIQAANYLDVKRANKMIVESAQMLSTALWEQGYEAPYKPTHRNHPCNVWARQTRANYNWLLDYAGQLAYRYYRRTGRIHKTAYHFAELALHADLIPEGPLTPFANCTIGFKNIADVHDAYRQYLKKRWENDIRTPVFDTF